MLTVTGITWVLDNLDRWVIADPVPNSWLPPRLDEDAASNPFASPDDVLSVDLDADGHWNMSVVPLSGVMDIRSRL